MKRFNILFLGGGKRVAMARMFLKACADLGLEGSVTGYEATETVPLATVGQIIAGKAWSDPELMADLHGIVVERDIHAVVPFVDPAVAVAARLAKRFGGDVFAPVSDETVCSAMYDKVRAAEAFERVGLPIPPTYRPGDPCLRLIAKPRFGSASKGIITINTLQKLYELQGQGDRYLIQERIDNRQELTVDCYASCRSGRVEAVSPRVRLEVSGGEAVRTVTVDDPEAVALATRTLEALRLRGAVTVQLIRDMDNGRLMVMEVNPRLGGGAVCSVHAGVDLPRLAVAEALGRPEPDALCLPRPGVLVARYLEDAVFKL